MLLGGLQRHSLIDYPGKVCCVCFVSGCNFRCPYCHNPDLARGRRMPPYPFDERGLREFLEKRRGFLDGVVVSGGEPTLANELCSFCEEVKSLGYAVKLDTNGSRPGVLKNLVRSGLVDYIAMDIKTEPHRYPWFTQGCCTAEQIHSSIQIIMESGLEYEFRTTCVRPFVDEPAVEHMARFIQGAGLYALQQFHHTEVLQPEYFVNIAPGYDNNEMEAMRSLAAPFVGSCIVRSSPSHQDYLKAA
ncbi:MAG: anaerobic ribonucleoside-triphosphate reductase activating protein [Deltaproteobacteria bacterium]|nr:anaerobic ribonucleoside-triphosphate reductase activating protein [Deltaproteobacteria bacterium]